MKIGVHSVLYADKIETAPELVIRQITQSGAKGCEISENYLRQDSGKTLRRAMDRCRMELAGVHCMGFHLIDVLENPEKAKQALYSAANIASSFDCSNLIVSGIIPVKEIRHESIRKGASIPELHNNLNVTEIAKWLNQMAMDVKESFGVQLHYHNHSWEFADQGLIWFTLAEHAPELKFALDIGWAEVSGIDSMELISQYSEKISYIHLRDCQDEDNLEISFEQARKSFPELGEGRLVSPDFIKQLKEKLDEDTWMIIEYETGEFCKDCYRKAVGYVEQWT